jgi:hypothetical protein
MDPRNDPAFQKQHDQTQSLGSALDPKTEARLTEIDNPQPVGGTDAYSAEEEDLVEQRLKNLGYL